MIKKIYNYLTPFQWFEILAVVGFSTYFAITDKTNPLWYIIASFVAAVCGVVCVVLCATGKRSQYYWGFINIIAYIIVSWVSKYYGEVMLNALYFLPTQFIGMYYWSKHYNSDNNEVKSKKMKFKAIVISLVACALCIWLYQILLTKLGGEQTWLDSASATFSIIANALMVLRYREQWILWIVIDGITVAMWIIAGDYIMTTMWSVYLLNAFYGLYQWTQMNKLSNAINE